MKMTYIFAGIFAIILFSSAAFAAPGIPHQFYGTIYVNDVAAPDNTILTASIDGDNYSTITMNGWYGKNPAPIFYVPDPDNNRDGNTIEFSVGGMTAGTYTFANNGYTQLNFDLITTCGDNYCLGDETCLSCQQDCGECPAESLSVYIHSPKDNATYTQKNVPLEVSSNQPIIVWMYVLNSGSNVVFYPNTTINAEKGQNNLTVVGINNIYQSASTAISFNVELLEADCGNNIKEEGEECDGNDLGSLTCASYGLNSGTLRCSPNCTIVLNDCHNVVQGSAPPSSSGGSAGGSIVGTSSGGTGSNASSSSETTCRERWLCSEWSACKDGIQTRTCTDTNNCGTDNDEPMTSQPCANEKATTASGHSTASAGPLGFFFGVENTTWAGIIIGIAIIGLLIYAFRKGKIKIPSWHKGFSSKAV